MRSSAGRVLDDKRLAEDFRARQHGGPHPLATSIGDVRPGSPRGGSPHPPPPAEDAGSRRRVIVHFDADCFYCQVEELRDPRLAERPVAVTQKYLIVTANYRARAAGLEKLMATSEARRLCPEVALISGEDLTPYRRCAKRVRRLLARFGTCEKLGLDECWVDVTAEVDRRVRAAGPGADPPLVGHRHVAARLVSSSNPHRPMDVRAKPDATTRVGTGVDVDADVDVDVDVDAAVSDERRLRVGAAIAAEAREALRLELGLRCSAGIAHNKMCAKLASGLHKPDDQTVLPRVETASTVAPLPLRALPGVGWATERALSQRGLRVAADARAATRETLCAWLGARVGAKTHDAAWGVDRDPVREKPPPAAVTCEDSFRACSSSDAVARVLAVLAPDLVSRVDEEHEDELERNHPRRVGRSPTTLTVKWRLAAGVRASTRENGRERPPPSACRRSPRIRTRTSPRARKRSPRRRSRCSDGAPARVQPDMFERRRVGVSTVDDGRARGVRDGRRRRRRSGSRWRVGRWRRRLGGGITTRRAHARLRWRRRWNGPRESANAASGDAEVSESGRRRNRGERVRMCAGRAPREVATRATKTKRTTVRNSSPISRIPRRRLREESASRVEGPRGGPSRLSLRKTREA